MIYGCTVDGSASTQSVLLKVMSKTKHESL